MLFGPVDILFPKNLMTLSAQVHSREQYKARLLLWDCLFNHLKSIGWITKGDGSKLMIDKAAREQPPET
jgi:hypothetical protein